MKAYTAYARGEGVWDHRTLFPQKSTFIFNHWQCIIKYCTCLECGQYAHICRSFMYNNTFEALFPTSKCTKRGFLWTQIVAPHRGFCKTAHRRYRIFSIVACGWIRGLNASQRSRVGVGINRSAKGLNVRLFELILVHKIAPNCEYFTNHLMQYVLQYFYNKKWDIRNTRNNEKSDSVELIHGLQRPLTRRGSNVHFYPFQCWEMKLCVKFNNK